jgi:hypothetical protein
MSRPGRRKTRDDFVQQRGREALGALLDPDPDKPWRPAWSGDQRRAWLAYLGDAAQPQELAAWEDYLNWPGQLALLDHILIADGDSAGSPPAVRRDVRGAPTGLRGGLLDAAHVGGLAVQRGGRRDPAALRWRCRRPLPRLAVRGADAADLRAAAVPVHRCGGPHRHGFGWAIR